MWLSPLCQNSKLHVYIIIDDGEQHAFQKLQNLVVIVYLLTYPTLASVSV